MVACEVGSASTVNRDVAVDFTGFYNDGSSGTTAIVTPHNSGASVKSLSIRQSGDRLEAVDNNGILFKGDIGNSPSATSPQAQITMTGKTTAGAKVTISGTISKGSASDTTATLYGTWIEPSFYATIRAVGSVSKTVTNAPPSTNTNLVIRATLPTAANGLSSAQTHQRLWFMNGKWDQA